MGQPPCLDSNQGDFFFLCRRSPDRLVQTVVELCRDRLPKSMGVEPGQIQVLSATRRGECGTVSLNRALQAALNPPARDKRQKLWGDMVFRVGDRIMQTKNNYDVLWTKDDGAVGSGIFNGDVGVIEDIDPAGELLTIRFDDRTAVYTAEESVTNRVLISEGLVEQLNAKLNDAGLYVTDVNIIDFDFSDAFINAIEEKQVAQQQLLKAETEKQTAITNAEAEAEATKIRAEAEAEANRSVSASLTDQIIQNKTVEKWDGKLPTVTGGSGTIISLPGAN